MIVMGSRVFRDEVEKSLNVLLRDDTSETFRSVKDTFIDNMENLAKMSQHTEMEFVKDVKVNEWYKTWANMHNIQEFWCSYCDGKRVDEIDKFVHSPCCEILKGGKPNE